MKDIGIEESWSLDDKWYRACGKGDIPLVKNLLDQCNKTYSGKNLELIIKNGIEQACMDNNLSVFKFLIELYKETNLDELLNDPKRNVLATALYNKSYDTFEYVLSQGIEFKYHKHIEDAACGGYLEALKYSYAHYDFTNYQEYTQKALNDAVKHYNSPESKISQSNYEQIIHYLISKGGNLELCEPASSQNVNTNWKKFIKLFKK